MRQSLVLIFLILGSSWVGNPFPAQGDEKPEAVQSIKTIKTEKDLREARFVLTGAGATDLYVEASKNPEKITAGRAFTLDVCRTPLKNLDFIPVLFLKEGRLQRGWLRNSQIGFFQELPVTLLKQQKALEPILFCPVDFEVQTLEDLKAKIRVLKAWLNWVRSRIYGDPAQGGITPEDVATLRRVIQEGDYSGIEIVRAKVIQRIYGLSRVERDFVALTMTAFGEARGGSSRTIEEIPINQKPRAEMLGVLKVVDNRLCEARRREPYASIECLDVILAPRQFSFLNEGDPNWIKWVLGPVPPEEEKNPDFRNYSQEHEFVQSLMAYLDFRCEKTEYCPGLQNPKTLHYCAASVVDEVGWAEDNPEARQVPSGEAWVRLPPPYRGETSAQAPHPSVFLEDHVFFENVRAGNNHLRAARFGE